MLLSLIGERLRTRHVGVQMAFAYGRRPRVATTLRKLSRYKYGVVAKQAKLGNAPDFVETLCGLDFLCVIDSSRENEESGKRTLEARLAEVLNDPSTVSRTGVVSLGLSDDLVDSITVAQPVTGMWHPLVPRIDGDIELPVWVDHIGALHTRWQRFVFSETTKTGFDAESDDFVTINDPR